MYYEGDGIAYINGVTGTKEAHKRIEDEASKIDLYVWIDRHRLGADQVTFPAPLVHRKEKPRVAAGFRVEAPGIEPPATRVENGRKRTQKDGNGRGSAGLNGKMRPFATAIRPDATASVYQVYQALRP